jgi:hypothetical protein
MDGPGKNLYRHPSVGVSCYFNEGYGMGFPFFVAPILTVITLMREGIVSKRTAQRNDLEFKKRLAEIANRLDA